MPENPPKKEDLNQNAEKLSEEKETPAENDAPRAEPKKRSYYYDDACGYEIYDADEDERDEN